MSSKNDELIASDPDFSKGETSFLFPNGDSYEGEYCAHRTGLVWRQGIGTYTTKDGQIYSGEWRDDKLVDNKSIEVTYPSGVEYVGRIVKNKYTGPGLYVLENKMSLLCEFLGNKPTGEISLIDITGREWHGVAEQNEALLLPEHIYFNNINEDRGKGQVRAEVSETKISSEETPSEERSVQEEQKKLASAEHMRERELKIFAKTKKVLSDLKFEDSRWFKRYMEFKQVHEDITKKIKESGEESLEESQKEWYEKYTQFKKRYFEIMEARKHNKKELSEYKLFELFNSDEYKNSHPPVSVVSGTEKSLVKELMFKDRKA